MDDLFGDIDFFLSQANLEGWLRVMGKDYIHADENGIVDPTRGWGQSVNTYEETELGNRLYGIKDFLPESYAQACHEVAKKAGNIEYGIPGSFSIRYTAGSDQFFIGNDPVPVSEIDAIIGVLRTIKPTSTQPMLTDASGYQAPDSNVGGLPVTNAGLASAELREMERKDRERAAKRYAEISSTSFPGRHDR